MEVKQIKQEKREVEQKIMELLLDFSKRTGVIVSDIDFRKMVTVGGDVISYEVSVEVTL